MLADLAVAAGIRSVVVKTLDEAVESDVDLIVNCTSAGLHPNVDASPWVEGVPIPKGVTLYDMVYRPEQTKLMRQIESAGGRTIGGLGMLVLQGAAAFKIWTGIDAPIDVMFAAARSKLAEAGKT
jgi:shikimate dehydrogenase